MTALTNEQWIELRAPFPPSAIGQKPKKNKTTGEITYLDYIGHAEITERLNSVDPEWIWAPMAVADDGAPLVRTNGDTLELWIELTVGGVTRPAVGTVDTGAWSGETAKELISDALRNAAMRFGVGLDLWKKRGGATPAPRDVTDSRPAVSAPAAATRSSNDGNTTPLTQGQSRNLYRLWHHVLKLDKEEYIDAILIATGLEGVKDDRELSMQDAGKVISYLKEQAGEVDEQRPAQQAPVDQAAPAPSDSLFEQGEPF